MSETAYLGLGSNVGPRTAWIDAALGALVSHGLELAAVSSCWLTEPVGDRSMPWFVNAVAAFRHVPEPVELLELCLDLEVGCGRDRSSRQVGPRTLDLDLLLYDSRTIGSEQLTIPHPRMHERRFVLEPLCEIAPELSHPVQGRTMLQLRDQLESPERAWLLAPSTWSTRA